MAVVPMVLVEPVPVPDIFLTGIMIEDRGSHVRVTGYADRDVGGTMERVIAARFVMTRLHFEMMVATALGANGKPQH